MGLAVAVGAAAAISVTTVLESVAVVGAVVGAVGAVTHNKVLSMVGLGLGIVGGIGALATSALGVGSAAITGGETAGAAAGGVDVASGGIAGMDAAEAAANPAAGIAASAASGAAPDVFGDFAGQVSGEIPTTMDAAEAASAPSGLLNGGLGATPTGGDVSLFSTTSESANPADVVAPGTTGTDTSTAAASGTPATATNPATAVSDAAATPPPTGPGTTGAGGTDIPWDMSVDPAKNSGPLSGIMNFVKENPKLTLGALQAGGSLLSGATDTLKPAQVAALNAQAAANNAAAALTQQQAANLNMPKSVASSAPVTGSPQPLVPGQQGLINAASRPVTGVAA